MASNTGTLVSLLDGAPTASLPLEIVERKGLGHPDSICDALVENLSIALSRFYLERFGAILHHNVDKGLLWGGTAQTRLRRWRGHRAYRGLYRRPRHRDLRGRDHSGG